VKAQPGDKTEATMHSDDDRFNLTMTIPTSTVREQRLTVGDAIDIDRVGDAGYTVRKGTATLGMEMAAATHMALDGMDDEVALIARSGQVCPSAG
jgi:hypothetical protein